MPVNINSEESRILRQLIPLTTFPSEAFKELCTNVTVEQVQDAVIFKKGDTNTDLVYLLDGSVILQAESLVVEVINSESESAKFALAHQIPRKIDAVANGSARIVRLDAHTVNNPPPAVYREDQSYTIIEESGEESDDWMTALLRLPLFQTLPPANLQKILISLKVKHYSEGDSIIDKDSDVNNFYLITKGQCLLTRNTWDSHNEIRLSVGESFGEEYLITDKPAQETVTALSDVSLIQLDKKNFLTQIKTPKLMFIALEEMPDAIKDGAIVLDVRSQRNYENHHLDDSANIPLLSLRFRIAEIPKEKQVIVVCANGLASETAAFLLVKNGFNAIALKGGMGVEEIDDETEMVGLVGNQEDISQPEISNHDLANQDGPVTDANAQLATVKAENDKLIELNRMLEEKNASLQAEKAQVEKQCQKLTQQIERLKEILKRFTKPQK